MTIDTALLADLNERGLIAQRTAEAELDEHLRVPRTVYCGFDPTADSLHIGSLVPLLALRRFQLAGHSPIVLVGGSTGLIGDPSFKADERTLQGPEAVQQRCDRLKTQIRRFVDFEQGAILVNNLDWTGHVSVLDFLRDVGKHFSVNAMIQKDSVRQRIDRAGSGISFTEFAYMLLQSWDFAELFRQYQCTVQIGGSDQWGNITGGTDLTRRLHGTRVFGLTMPLITRTDGAKFGKTECGTVWLDASKTSPYAFYQFWLQTADADVYRFLRYFTFLGVADIDRLEREDARCQGRPEAQRVLAEEVTRLVHGEDALRAARRITHALFSGNTDDLSVEDFKQLGQDGLPCSVLTDFDLGTTPLTTIFTQAGLAKNGKQVKDALTGAAMRVNGASLSWNDNMHAHAVFAPDNARHGRYYLVRLGKKSYHLFTA